MNVMHKTNPAQAITTNTIAAIRSLLNFRKSVFIAKGYLSGREGHLNQEIFSNPVTLHDSKLPRY